MSRQNIPDFNTFRNPNGDMLQMQKRLQMGTQKGKETDLYVNNQMSVRGQLVPEPTPPLSGLTAWWDYSHVPSRITSSGYLSGIRDRLTPAKLMNFNEAPVSNGADIVTLNGREAARFKSTNNGVTCTGGTFTLPETSDFTSYVVYRTTANDGNAVLFGPALNTTVDGYMQSRAVFLCVTPASSNTLFELATSANVPAGVGNVVVIEKLQYTRSSNEQQMSLTNSSFGTLTFVPSLAPDATRRYVTRSALPQGFQFITLGEHIMYNKLMTPQENTDVISYLTAKWGITPI